MTLDEVLVRQANLPPVGSRRKREKRRRQTMAGVTLIELMLVVALVGVLAAIATPYFRDMAGRYRLNSAAQDTVNLIQRARVFAVSHNLRTRVVFTQVDPAPSTESSVKGVLRIEQWNAGLATPIWTVINGVLPAASVSGSTCTGLGSACLNVAGTYLNVSLTYVDPVGGTLALNRGLPMIEFTPEGVVANTLTDFQYGSNKQEIMTVLTYKKASGQKDSRIVWVNRAGGIRQVSYRGSSLPTP